MTATEIQLDRYRIGANHDVFVIAEVGMAHDGSLGAAHAFIDAVAETGAQAVKFQTHIAEAESTSRETFRVPVFPQDATRFDYWKRTEFSPSQWRELAIHAKDRGLVFLSSPFSARAVDWLMECDVPAWKIASGELSNFPMLRLMAATGRPLLISSGMSSWSELDETVKYVARLNASFGIFQCTTSYPCPPEEWGLNIIPEMLKRYDCPVGLSDHSGTIVPGLAAVTLGASMLEFHVAFSKKQFGPDSRASLTFPEAADLVQGVRSLRRALMHPIDKDQQAVKLQPLHELFTKSVVSARKLPSGHILVEHDLAFKKPGTGISAKLADQLVGRKLKQEVPADHFFSETDFE